MKTRQSYSQDDRFFLFYTVGLFLIVFLAFAPGFLDPESRGLPLYMHIHAGVLVGWFLTLILQSWLVREGKAGVHAKIGVVAAVYGYLIAPGALLATLNVVSRFNSVGISLETDMSVVNPALGAGMTFLLVASKVVWTNILAVCSFVILLTTAIVLRRKSAIHKRLILLATVSIMGPAFARLSRMDFLGGEQGPFIPLAMLSLLAILFFYDYVRLRKIHAATWMASILIVSLNALGLFISGTEKGLQFVRNLA